MPKHMHMHFLSCVQRWGWGGQGKGEESLGKEAAIGGLAGRPATC